MNDTTKLGYARALDRAEFLKLAGAAGIGASLGAGVLTGVAEARVKTRLQPTNFSFSIVEQFRKFDLLAENFVELSDDFESDTSGDYTLLSPPPERTLGTVEISGGEASISGNEHYTVLRSGTGQRAPYTAVILDVKSLVGAGEGPEDSIFAGLYKDENNYVHAFYNNRQGIVGFDAVVNGEVFPLGTTVEAELTPPFRFAFVATENEVTALVSDESDFGFRPLLKRNAFADSGERVDMRTRVFLSEYNNGFGARANTGGEIVLENVEAGYFGEAGLRDPHLVTYADGTPYIRDDKAYMTFTNAGLGFFATAHWGVWTLDLASYELEQVGNLFFTRDGMGRVYGDHAGHLVFDEENDRFIVSMSTWGDFDFDEVRINYATVPASVDVLSGVHILETRRLPLPLSELSTPTAGQWDPHIVRIEEKWYVAFVNAREFFNFYPALASSDDGGVFTRTSLVGADTEKVETEGPVMQKLAGKWLLLASNGDASPEEIRQQYPMYDLDMNFVGNLDAPHSTNIPWPMIIPVTSGGATRYVLVTFQGTQYEEGILGYGTHGDTVIMEAAQRVRGSEF